MNNDLISKQTLLNALKENGMMNNKIYAEVIKSIIETIPIVNEIEIETPAGILVAIPNGDDDYPRIDINIKTKDELNCVTYVEYDSLKETLQTIVYNNEFNMDEPSHIIELDNVMKDIEAANNDIERE